MNPRQTLVAAAIACLFAPSWLSARTIMLDDNRNGIIQIAEFVAFDFFSNGELATNVVATPTTKSRSGVTFADNSEIVLANWFIALGAQKAAASFEIHGAPFSIDVSVDEWESDIIHSFDSPLQRRENDQPGLYRLEVPPEITDFVLPPVHGSVSITGPSGVPTSLDFLLPFDGGEVVAGEIVLPEHPQLFYFLGLHSRRDIPLTAVVDGVVFDLKSGVQLDISIAPEPSGDVLVLASMLIVFVRRQSIRRVRPLGASD